MTLADKRLETALPDKKPLYTDSEAKAEAERCLYCVDAPCVKACPTTIDIPTFIKKIATGNTRGAAKTIFDQNLLGHSCARVCPVEVLCAGDCVYNAWEREPIAIGRLQRYATETQTAKGKLPIYQPKKNPNPKKVALIGAGPASLACAGALALEGHKAVVFEKRSVAGGLNTTGIAPYKLHAEDALHEVEWVRSFGVEIKTNAEVDKDSAQKLLADYDAVFLGVGLGADTRLGIPGEDGVGVYGATHWIEAMKLQTNAPSPKGKRVLVIGGGNTAIDVARECALLGAADVAMVYRRSQQDMSGYAHELDGARTEGVRLIDNSVPVSVVRDDKGALVALRVAKADKGKAIAGTEHDLHCDMIAVAIGQSKLRELATSFAGVELDDRGCIKAHADTCQTGNAKVFAGGDAINGGKEVVNAVADGRNAARTLIARFAGA
jgi:glutamate synthase (NADPH/NADH) small chain